MVHYRLYTLNGGHIERARDVECADDTQALERALGLTGAQAIEIWQGARKVGTIKPDAFPSGASR